MGTFIAWFCTRKVSSLFSEAYCKILQSFSDFFGWYGHLTSLISPPRDSTAIPGALSNIISCIVETTSGGTSVLDLSLRSSQQSWISELRLVSLDALHCETQLTVTYHQLLHCSLCSITHCIITLQEFAKITSLFWPFCTSPSHVNLAGKLFTKDTR